VKDIDANGLVAELRTPGGQPAISERDIITRINRTPVSSLADFQRVLNGLKPGDPIVLNMIRILRDMKGDRQVPLIVQFTYQ
jgi:S1-C subfamily serine protease